MRGVDRRAFFGFRKDALFGLRAETRVTSRILPVLAAATRPAMW